MGQLTFFLDQNAMLHARRGGVRWYQGEGGMRCQRFNLKGCRLLEYLAQKKTQPPNTLHWDDA